jgi:hypothetical protein
VYVILTSKPGQFRTEISEGLRPVEAYDYVFCGRKRARFLIAELEKETRLRIVDETPPEVVNLVPSKFLQRYDSLDGARQELRHLVSFGSMPMALEPAPLA